MGKKRGRPKCVAEAVDEEELKEMTAFCERYSKIDEDIEDNQFRIKRFKEKLDTATSDIEKTLYLQEIKRLSHQVEEDIKSKALFNWGLMQLEDRTRHVLEQLYIQDINWSDVESESGWSLTNGSVGNERLKGLKQLTLIVSKKRKEMERPTDNFTDSNKSYI